METYLQNQINLCENSKLYMLTEFFKNILKVYNSVSIEQFSIFIDFNIIESPEYFKNELLTIKSML